MSALEWAIRLEGIERVHGGGQRLVRALGPLDLRVARGELLAVMGPSGSGKSTLLHLVAGLDQPSAGRVFVLGQDLALASAEQRSALRRRELGFVFQDLNLIPGLNALENVALPLELGGWRAKPARTAAEQALEWVGLGDKLARFPADLSGGEQQRVAIARATVGPRRLIVADEPTGALDSVQAENVLRLVRGFCDQGGTALIATHDPLQAAWADRIVVLRDGRLQAESPGDQAGAALLQVQGRTKG